MLAAGAGVLFAYVAWVPQPPPGVSEPSSKPVQLPAKMLEGLRERGLLRPDQSTIPPPPAAATDEAAIDVTDRDTVTLRDTGWALNNAMRIAEVSRKMGATNRLRMTAVSAHSRAPPA